VRHAKIDNVVEEDVPRGRYLPRSLT